MNKMQAHDTSLIAARKIDRGANDRTVFNAEALDDLAASIRDNGLAQPITVRPLRHGRYEIVAGERRFRACAQLLGWTSVPCIVREMDDAQAAAIMLAENVARTDLDPVDEAQAYQSRIERYGWTVDEVATRAGVSTIRVQFRLKLLALRPELLQLVRSGQLPIGYAQTVSAAGLDANRQAVAVRLLQENASPTPGWFRRVVGTLVEEQSQESLFDVELLAPSVSLAESAAATEPPHPSTTVPPSAGRTTKAIIRGQVAYWTDAARQWADLGKPFKRQECEAAAQALRAALGALA